jgi:hypothetical protein
LGLQQVVVDIYLKAAWAWRLRQVLLKNTFIQCPLEHTMQLLGLCIEQENGLLVPDAEHHGSVMGVKHLLLHPLGCFCAA